MLVISSGAFVLVHKINMGHIYWKTGRKEETVELLNKHREYWEAIEGHHSKHFHLAENYSVSGEEEKAFRLICGLLFPFCFLY